MLGVAESRILALDQDFHREPESGIEPLTYALREPSDASR